MKKYLPVLFLLITLAACKNTSGPNDPNAPLYARLRLKSFTATLTGARFDSGQGGYHSVEIPVNGTSSAVSSSNCQGVRIGDTTSFCGYGRGFLLADINHRTLSGQVQSSDIHQDFSENWGWQSTMTYSKIPYVKLNDTTLVVSVSPTIDIVPFAGYSHYRRPNAASQIGNDTEWESYDGLSGFNTGAMLKMTLILDK